MNRLPSLNAVRYFAAAARLQSFTAAAQELNVTQGAISRMVQALEQDLGVQLFIRNGRYIALTATGQTYYEEVSAALDRIGAASKQVQRTMKNETLALIVNSGFATRWLVPRLPEFQRSHPDIHVEILASEADESIQGQQAPITIRLGTPPWGGCVVTRLPMGSTFGVVCSPRLRDSHDLKQPQDLLGLPLLAHSSASRDFWQEYFESFGLSRPDLGQTPRFHQLLMLAEAAISGMGFAVVPLFLFEPELRSNRLVQAIPHTLESQRGYFITHPRGADHDRKVQVFKKWLLSQANKTQPIL